MGYIKVPSLNKLLADFVYDGDPSIVPIVRTTRDWPMENWTVSGAFQVWLAKKRVDNAWFTKRLLGSVHIDPFTGNCGAKAFSQLSLCTTGQGKPDHELKKHVLFLMETYMLKAFEASLIVGSDHSSGTVITTIRKYGTGYKYGEKVWNSRYEERDHTIRLFYKDLADQKDRYELEYKEWRTA